MHVLRDPPQLLPFSALELGRAPPFVSRRPSAPRRSLVETNQRDRSNASGHEARRCPFAITDEVRDEGSGKGTSHPHAHREPRVFWLPPRHDPATPRPYQQPDAEKQNQFHDDNMN
jgi:hypothetical protein